MQAERQQDGKADHGEPAPREATGSSTLRIYSTGYVWASHGERPSHTPTLEKNFAPKKVPKNVFLGISFVT